VGLLRLIRLETLGWAPFNPWVLCPGFLPFQRKPIIGVTRRTFWGCPELEGNGLGKDPWSSPRRKENPGIPSVPLGPGSLIFQAPERWARPPGLLLAFYGRTFSQKLGVPRRTI